MTRVLFIHGLESGPNGTKVQRMRALGFDVDAADMEMSLFRFRKKHSVVRNILRQKVVWLVAFLYVALNVVGFMGHAYGLNVVGHLVAIVGLFLLRRPLFQRAARMSMQQCVEVQTEAVATSSPDVIVGSSWGGAIALELVRRDIWSGPTILLAPAYIRALLMSGFSDDEIEARLTEIDTKLSSHTPIIIHDPSDDTVPFHHSTILAENGTYDLRSVEAGGHRLLGILEDGSLEQAINQIAA